MANLEQVSEHKKFLGLVNDNDNKNQSNKILFKFKELLNINKHYLYISTRNAYYLETKELMN